MPRYTTPMTEGSIPRHLLRYAFPAILGDLFQVTYNTVDSIIVGKYAGPAALAAVGIASPLMISPSVRNASALRSPRAIPSGSATQSRSESCTSRHAT